MRRLWSYVVLAGTAIVLMGSTFSNVFKNSTSNIEFSDGKEMVFRISEKDESELVEKNENGETPAEVISKNMIERLDSLKITGYEVATESYDTVKVTVRGDDDNYSNIQALMTFNGSLALSSKKNDFRVNSDETEKFLAGNAYLETKNDYPTVNIPVGDHFKEIYDIVKQYKEDNDTEAAESQTTGEGEESETTYSYYLYLWHDYEDGDTYEQTQSGTEDYNPHVAEKVFMKFDISELISQEEEGEELDTLTAYVNIQDANSDGKYEARDVRKAFNNATRSSGLKEWAGCCPRASCATPPPAQRALNTPRRGIILRPPRRPGVTRKRSMRLMISWCSAVKPRACRNPCSAGCTIGACASPCGRTQDP